MNASCIRCAIYTRKNSDEGLDQEFNSLDAQYEACAAYIASQRQEGWHLISQRFDDGGLSGGTLERPELIALLAEIHAGRIDQIVMYKIDRLTRSLTDFAKIVDQLDAAGASFVSVTQSFNTATSMGRLTLNMLLSFAQFEREVTAERIRDKIAASKAKGLWMGGLPPLGYDPHPDKTVRGLVVNESEAATIRKIFTLYDEFNCLRRVEKIADQQGLRSKLRHFASGKIRGGTPLSRGAIHKLLTNPIYIGKIKHKDKLYDGQHKAIVDDALWARVQDKLQTASRKRRGSISDPHSKTLTPLKGKLFDETGDHLTPSHTKKTGRIFRYYISNRLLKRKDPAAWRFPAKQLEQTIDKLISQHLKQAARSHRFLRCPGIQQTRQLESAITDWLVENRRNAQETKLRCLTLLCRAEIGPGKIQITISDKSLAKLFSLDLTALNTDALEFTSTLSLQRRGFEAKLIAGEFTSDIDHTLQSALARAHGWMASLKAGQSIREIAQSERVTRRYIH